MNSQSLKFIKARLHEIKEKIYSDPYLRYCLIVTLILTGSWFWYRTPNFAGPDEYSRLIQPMKVVGNFVSSPSTHALQSGVLDGRALGATFYLYSITLVPLFMIVLLTGQLGEFATLGTISSRWELWHEAPSWFWTGAIVSGRITLMIFATGCVYLMYLVGDELWNKTTARMSAILLSITFGFIAMAHEVSEDIPAIFFILLTLYLLLLFIDTNNERLFWAATLSGGIAIAFKLTAGAVVMGIGGALLVRAFTHHENWKAELFRPRLIGGGLALGIVAIYVGMPSILLGGPDELLLRITHTTGQKTSLSGGQSAPIWVWMASGYLNGLGLPLATAICLGAPASVVLARTNDVDAGKLSVVGLSALPYFVVFSRWEYVRMHHLLPTFPLMILLLSATITYLIRQKPKSGRILVGFLVVSTALYSGVGVMQYGSEPRDQATGWIETNVEDDEEMVVYENSIADVAAVHGKPVQHYPYPEENATYESTLILNQSNYTEWMTSTTDRNPKYIQLTLGEIRYIDPNSPRSEKYPRRSDHIESLMNEETNYTIVAEFGSRPTFEAPPDRLLWEGIVATPPQKERYIVILKSDS